ncbi:hypothetical protein FB45DRAFT_756850 [Roridomyces roridus]|uniref:Protein-S-isoprenylcysteine O-methyltransferase n=1 Tax=Roridomyces roridus TaxID=1738132 RepID=A0AAD7BCX6_9AGAR|nr:hypothetical protein FB45DRAFT_756850 [Roridomyces roridus]
MTPPHPPPPKAEQLPPTGLEKLGPRWFPLILKVRRLGHLLVHAGFWVAGFVEIAVLTAHAVPSLPIAPFILHTFDSTSSATRLRTTPLFLMGCALNFLGTAIRISCYRRLRTLFTFQLSIRENHKLITDGMFSIVRHPSYSGAVLAAVGVGLCHLTPGSWVVECVAHAGSWEVWMWRILPVWIGGLSLASHGLSVRMRKEDAMLKENFGKEWEVWAGRVRYKIIPGVV